MANYQIIGGDHKEYGPVTADEVREWIAEGRLSGQSLVKLEGTNEWKPLAMFPEFAAAPGPFPEPPQLSTSGAPANPTSWTGLILARKPDLRMGECLNGGMSFFLSNLGFVIGCVFLAWAANFLFAFFPLIGGIVHLLLSGVVMGGLYLACLRRMRGEPASIGDVFAGFKNNFVQLMLAGAISKMLTQIGFLVCTLPGIYLVVAWVFALPLVADRRLEFWSAMELSRKVVTRVWPQMALLLLLAFLPFIIGQVIVSVKLFGFLMTTWTEANHDPMRWLDWLRQHMDEFMKQLLSAALMVQIAMLLSLFFAVGVVARAYENLFGERKP
ncbi:MAG: DUF4339 domain-containing protein [Pedosphaera sp.]|nr:DUF4339 domain-containing protein [Pedosphaera sp.]